MRRGNATQLVRLGETGGSGGHSELARDLASAAKRPRVRIRSGGKPAPTRVFAIGGDSARSNARLIR